VKFFYNVLHVNCSVRSGVFQKDRYTNSRPTFVLWHIVNKAIEDSKLRLRASEWKPQRPFVGIRMIIMWKHDVIHKTRSAWHIALMPEEHRAIATVLRAEYFVKFGQVVFEIQYASVRTYANTDTHTDRHTDRHTGTLISILCTPPRAK